MMAKSATPSARAQERTFAAKHVHAAQYDRRDDVHLISVEGVGVHAAHNADVRYPRHAADKTHEAVGEHLHQLYVKAYALCGDNVAPDGKTRRAPSWCGAG